MANKVLILFIFISLGLFGHEQAHALLIDGPQGIRGTNAGYGSGVYADPDPYAQEVSPAQPVYPYVLGTPFDVLPPGFITLILGGDTYYYVKGVFYRKIIRDQKYVAVPPPIGAVVYTIPDGYQMAVVEGMAYYFYNGVYYKRVLEGYRVIVPPVALAVSAF